MQQLNDATGETVNLAVPRNNTVVQVAQIDSTFLLGTVNWVDVDVPPHCSALGKVFYAAGAIDLPTDVLERRTDHTITDPAALALHLDRIRVEGYAVALGELEIGLDAVAAPVLGRGDEVIAALGISGPSDRINHRLPQLGHLLIRHADQLSDALGLSSPTGTRPTHAPTSMKGKEGAA